MYLAYRKNVHIMRQRSKTKVTHGHGVLLTGRL